MMTADEEVEIMTAVSQPYNVRRGGLKYPKDGNFFCDCDYLNLLSAPSIFAGVDGACAKEKLRSRGRRARRAK